MNRERTMEPGAMEVSLEHSATHQDDILVALPPEAPLDVAPVDQDEPEQIKSRGVGGGVSSKSKLLKLLGGIVVAGGVIALVVLGATGNLSGSSPSVSPEPIAAPSFMPSPSPSVNPTTSDVPTLSPTHPPSEIPTVPPSDFPSEIPSVSPTSAPSSMPTCSDHQRCVLERFFLATDGLTAWVQRDGWGSAASVCEWFGVTCDVAGDGGGTITEINLSNNNVSGEINDELTRLPGLKILDLSANAISGNLPVDLKNAQSLEILNLSANQFTGSIPPVFGTMTTLIDLNLSDNTLSGNVPNELSNLVNLEVLELQNNSGLTGQLDIGTPVCSLFGSDGSLTRLFSDCEAPRISCQCCTQCF